MLRLVSLGTQPGGVVGRVSTVCHRLSSRPTHLGSRKTIRDSRALFRVDGWMRVAAAASRSDPPVPPQTRRQHRDAHQHAKRLKLVGNDGGSRVSSAAARLGLAVENVSLAGGVDNVVTRAVELSSNPDERSLEIALGLVRDACIVAHANSQNAQRALERRIALEQQEGSLKNSTSTVDGGNPNGERDAAPPTTSSLENASQQLSRTYHSTQHVTAKIEKALQKRLLEDEWLSTIVTCASSDFRRDRKKPRVRAKDRRCNQPKARQGWDKKGLRQFRVRICAGCDRMVPSEELVRICRVAVGHSENEDDEVSSSDGIGSQNTKHTKSTYAVAVDVSSLRADDFRLFELISPNGVHSALTRECAESGHAAEAMASRGAELMDPLWSTDPHGQTKKSKKPKRLQGRATYVCRRGFCARRVSKGKAVKRGLKVSPGGHVTNGDNNSGTLSKKEQNSNATAFYEALINFCDAAEKVDCVDSSQWDSVREPGVPSRWDAHPVIVDLKTRQEVESEVLKRVRVKGGVSE